jgi:hypothetical protein
LVISGVGVGVELDGVWRYFIPKKKARASKPITIKKIKKATAEFWLFVGWLWSSSSAMVIFLAPSFHFVNICNFKAFLFSCKTQGFALILQNSSVSLLFACNIQGFTL